MIDFLASIPILQGSNPSALNILAEHLETISLSTGDVLVQQGERADSLYIVVSGTLLVETTAPDGSQRPLTTLGRGDCIGEIALLFGTTRTATVLATTDARLLKITASALERFFEAEPLARERFLEVSSRRLLSLHLASAPLFAGLDAATLGEFDREANWLRLAGGETLFAQGDAPDAFYVVVHGRLDVVVEQGGQRTVVEHIGRGACVGEMAMLTGEPRSATIRAARDTELLRLSKHDFDAFLARHPGGAVEIARTLARRLQHTTTQRESRQRTSTIALLPARGSLVPPRFVQRFVEALSSVAGRTLRLSSRREDLVAAGLDTQGAGDTYHTRLVRWLGEQEEKYEHVVLECDESPSAWTTVCLRQADLIFIVAAAEGDPEPGESESRLLLNREGALSPTRTELVLLHASPNRRPAGTMRWLRPRRVHAHHHVRLDAVQDHERLARFATGRAVGVVFGGGGARGYLHLGVVQALRESGVPIDTVGGTSIGAVVAAQCALDYDIEQMIEMGTTGVAANIGSHLIRDTTFPIVAFLSARRVVKMIKAIFGDTRIEDLWLPFFCVSANLSTATLMVHDRGPLWLGLRASGSAPGILPPVLYHGELLVDGGLLRNVPVDTMRNRGAGTVIASDIALPVDLTVAPRPRVALSGWSLLWDALRRRPDRKQSVPHIVNILFRTAMLNTIHNTDVLRREADLYLHPVATGVNTLDWKAGRQLVALGYEYTRAEIADWKQAGGLGACHPS